MNRLGCILVVFYLHPQVPWVEVLNPAALIQTSAILRKRFVTVRAIPMDRPATEAGDQKWNHMLNHKITLHFTMNHKIKMMMTP
jgi:hypothetical protein